MLQVIDCGSGAGFFGTANGNQGDAKIRGAEIDWSFQATDRLYLNLSAGYTLGIAGRRESIPSWQSATLTGVFEEPLGVKGELAGGAGSHIQPERNLQLPVHFETVRIRGTSISATIIREARTPSTRKGRGEIRRLRPGGRAYRCRR